MSEFSKSFTHEEELEICRSYKNAADPSKQVSILADLNGCDKHSIYCVLEKANLIPSIKPTKPAKSTNPKKAVSSGKRMKWDSATLEELKQLRSEHKTYNQIAAHFGINAGQVANAIQKYRTVIYDNACDAHNSNKSANISTKASESNYYPCLESPKTETKLVATETAEVDTLRTVKSGIDLIMSLSETLSIKKNITSEDAYQIGVIVGKIYSIATHLKCIFEDGDD